MYSPAAPTWRRWRGWWASSACGWGKPWPDAFGNALWRGTRREEPEILPGAIHQIDERRMIDGGVVAFFTQHLGVIDLVRVRRFADRCGIAGEPDQARVKHCHIVGEMRGRGACGIDRDEQRLHGLSRGPELVERQADVLQIRRADVRAIGEAEIDQHELAAEVGIGARLAGMIDEREWTADRLASPHQDVHDLGGRALLLGARRS